MSVEPDVEPLSPETVAQVFDILEPSTARKRALLAQQLKDLPDDAKLWRTVKVGKQLADARDELKVLRTKCGRAVRNGGQSTPEQIRWRIQNLSDVARAKLLWAQAWERPEGEEHLIQSGTAMAEIDAILDQDPSQLIPAIARALDMLPKKTNKHGGKRRSPNLALRLTIRELAVMFWEFQGRKPGISVNRKTGVPTGRFLQLLQTLVPALGWRDLSPKALRRHWLNVRDLDGWGQKKT